MRERKRKTLPSHTKPSSRKAPFPLTRRNNVPPAGPVPPGIKPPPAGASLAGTFLFLSFLRAATQLFIHPCCLHIEFFSERRGAVRDVLQVSVASQKEGIARRFLLYRSFLKSSRMRPFGLGSDILFYPLFYFVNVGSLALQLADVS